MHARARPRPTAAGTMKKKAVASPSAAAALALVLLLCSAVSTVSGQQKQTADNNPRLQKAYVALQALKRAITDDPKNLTANWCGPDVCAYFGVFCTTAPDDPHSETVAGLDLNHGDLAGTFPEELGLLTDLALLHLNSNRFAGGLPESLPKLRLLHELDVSNNNLTGGFPQHILCLPNIRYVDLRFNGLCGPVPPALFDKKLDAIFLNDNHFDFELPENFGNSPASVVVLANLRLRGCIPESVGKMAGTLNELVVLNAGLRSCIPQEVGWLRELTVLDLSFNELQGMLPPCRSPWPGCTSSSSSTSRTTSCGAISPRASARCRRSGTSPTRTTTSAPSRSVASTSAASTTGRTASPDGPTSGPPISASPSCTARRCTATSTAASGRRRTTRDWWRYVGDDRERDAAGSVAGSPRRAGPTCKIGWWWWDVRSKRANW